MVMGGHNQVTQFIGLTAGKLPRLNQFHPVKGRPVATAVLVPSTDSGNALVQELRYPRVADDAAEELPGTAGLRLQVSVQASDLSDAGVVVASFLGRLRDNAVTGIYAVQLVGSAAPTEKCPESPRQFGSLNFDNHLWLGASVRDVEAAFGSALPASDGWWRYSCVGKETDARQGKPVEFDVFSRFDIKL
jgi:hypothetical protein